MAAISHDGLLSALGNIAIGIQGINKTKPNAELSFSQYSGGVIEDSLTGNYIPQTTTTITLKCELWQAKDPYTEENPGLNRSRIYFEGHLIEPLTYDRPLPEMLNAKLLFQGTYRIGKFYPFINFADSISEAISLDSALGQEIKGYFELEEGH